MSFAAAFLAVASRHGQRISLERDGEVLGSGLAILRPIFDRKGQFLPTDLGLERREQVLCMAEAALPFDPAPGRTLVRCEEGTYRVVNVRRVTAGLELVYWRAILEGEVEDL
ncbi:MAG: hypothetical protein IJO69_03505 [Ruminiclostridium sp.]|nr:hypothetical protein [Ruminiclostridium sp.]MBQ9932885.1 hypothetical protein [Ruminiclostridium sp.]